MRKMTFLLEEDPEVFAGTMYPGREIRHVHSELDYLNDVLARFKDFLQGVGYVIDGDIEVVNNEHEPNIKDEDEDAAQDTDMDGC